MQTKLKSKETTRSKTAEDERVMKRTTFAMRRNLDEMLSCAQIVAISCPREATKLLWACTVRVSRLHHMTPFFTFKLGLRSLKGWGFTGDYGTCNWLPIYTATVTGLSKNTRRHGSQDLERIVLREVTGSRARVVGEAVDASGNPLPTTACAKSAFGTTWRASTAHSLFKPRPQFTTDGLASLQNTIK